MPSTRCLLLFVAIIGCIAVTTVESKSKGSHSCIKSCDDCKKECNNLGGHGSRCSISKPRRPSDFCSCTGLTTIAVCGGAGHLTASIFTFLPFIAAFFYKAHIN